ncbi:MAG: putative metal-binding motif-containing protein, partial [Myxococcales bacterium]|nr:putative metal-binding motif-containing protein [Myxococcales bacterium]
MRHQHKNCVIRLGLFAALLGFFACAEERQPEPNAGLLADYASGVDAAFGVETFNLGEPTITVTAPTENQKWKIAVGGGVDVVIKFTTKNFTPGLIRCYLDGKLNGASTGTSHTYKGVKLGYHTLACVLVDTSGEELTNKEAREVRHVIVTQECLINDTCDDGLACTIALCDEVGDNGKFQCRFELGNYCCGSDYDCSPGEKCLYPNTESSQCTVCTKNTDCDDKNKCTTDSCDLSGVKGKCKHIKADPECCVSSDAECDDGLGCTIDSCDVVNGKCKHVQPVGSCCKDTECTSEDTCLVGSCVDYQCRFDVHGFKPDCCSSGTNTKCDDANYCTVDKCDQVQTGGWTKCSHTADQTKPNCCGGDDPNAACDDKKACTWDYCQSNQCYNVPIKGCCAADTDCTDNNSCTVDSCKKEAATDASGVCDFAKTPGCCNQLADCDDGLFCTDDSCDTTKKVCSYTKKANCCDADTDCNDGKYCTNDSCINNSCIGIKDGFKENCCDSAVDCSDGLACTVDSCDTSKHQCSFVDNGDSTCCNGPSDCDDKKCTTFDFCGTDNKCATKPDTTKCTSASECDDGDACTTNTCDTSSGCGECKYVPIENCCKFDSMCDDGDLCTNDTCLSGKCGHSDKTDCCIDDKDALTACDDKNACTIDYCLNNSCRHTAPKDGCCASGADCDDNWSCTTDKCNNIDATTGKGTCSNVKDDACGCSSDTECDDKNLCTKDACVSASCTHAPIQGCCLDAFDCGDGNACTNDYCVYNQCLSIESTGAGGLCCSVENEASDCAHLSSQCKVGKCKTQPDGGRSCVAVAKEVCTFDLNYCQDFSESTDLKLMGWNPANVKGTAATNWAVDTTGGLGPDNYARFTWTPIKVDYDTCLQSPIFQAAGAKTITIQLDREFVHNSGNSTIRVLGSLDGAAADWTKGILVDTVTPAKDIAAETMSVKLPPELSGSNGLRLAVCASGGSTYNLTRFGVDNFCVAKGSAPSFAACPSNQTLLAGESLTVPVKATDPDLSDIVSFQMVKGPAFVTVSSALYYWLDGSWNASVAMNPKAADIGEHEITIKVTDGFLYKLCTFKVTVGYEGGVLIWKPTAVPLSNATPLYNSIKKLGKQVQIATDMSLYKNLASFDAIFLVLGVFPDNHVLKESEIGDLKLYLSGGGRMYIEGGDTWSFDSPTTLHSFFKVNAVLDSSPNGVTGPLDGFMAYADAAQNKNYKWAYDQSFTWNNLNDQIGAKSTIKRTDNLLRNSGTEKFWVHVAHDDPTAKYRTIASSILFGGVKASTDSPDDLVKLMFAFFDNGFSSCTADSQCSDGDGCTKDTCASGVCTHNNTCKCNAATALTCGDNELSLLTSGGNATDIVESYSCLSGTTFSGKEVAYSFSSATSVPVVLSLANVSSDKVRLFVLKATSIGCDPTNCIATVAVATGKASVSFPAQANITYYIVVDGIGDTDTAKFDLKVDCSSGEICDDGKDNNNNGKTDCDDWASCCGHAACGEVCDGIDNDCDNTTDEDCDEDGDGFCAVTAKVKKSAKCLKSKLPTDDSAIAGDDCADADGTVNPSAKEICNNKKDDNCNGVQDEEGASGCVNYYSDLDGDGFGAGVAKCLCAPSGAFKATKGGDCNDASKDINPSAAELCSTTADDNCSGGNNDVNATGCKNFYTDQDSDDWGTTPFKCICTAEGAFKSLKPGDCDDASQPINPGAVESCNNKDDDCDSVTDEGCDDDGDGYCDVDLKIDTSQATILACPKGGGDTVDTDNKINPEGLEICDNKDNDSDGQTDEGCDDDADDYCDGTMITLGTPTICKLGGGDCNDGTAKINPGVNEDCATTADDNCNGDTNDIGSTGCKPFFYDGDLDAWGTNVSQCRCKAKSPYVAVNPGDCKDANPKINPAATEFCDDLDNNCDGKVDEICDTDGDHYCVKGVTLVGTPKVCSNGGNDCDDKDASVNPGKAEVCNNNKDDNCDGSQNSENAIYCINLYKDGDKDTYGAGTAKCFCSATTEYTTTKAGDCNDTVATIKPGVVEICDNIDNNCDGKIDEGCDDDGDDYCDANLTMVGTPTVCPKGGNDCNDADASVYKGKAAEVCDN